MKQEIFVYQLYKGAGVVLMEDGQLVARVVGRDERELLNDLSDELKSRFALGSNGDNFFVYRTEQLSDGYLSAFLHAVRDIEIERETIIVSRHAGVVEWLRSRGITGEVVTHVNDPTEIAGKDVIGILPLHLASVAASITTIDMPGLPADKRGVDLTPAEMDAYGAHFSVYRITRG